MKNLLLLLSLIIGTPAQAAEPIKIGDISSYSLDANSVTAYENGVKMAIEEINKGGGALGRPLEYLLRDDKGDPAAAIRIAEELVMRDKVDMLTGAWYNATAAAISTYANKNKLPFFATFSPGDKIIGKYKTPYAYSLWPTTRTETSALAEEAVKSGRKTWALVVPTFDDGIMAENTFREGLKKIPGAKIVYSNHYEAEKLNAASLLPILIRKNPEGILFLGLPADVTHFVREMEARKALKKVQFYSLWNGYPDVRESVGNSLPDGWVVTGYPVEDIATPEHKKFVAEYRKRYKSYPTYGSLHGYIGYKLIVSAIQKAGGVDHDKLAAAFEGLEIKNTPLGDIRIDAATHQSNIGTYVGTIFHKDGQAFMANWRAVPPVEVKP